MIVHGNRQYVLEGIGEWIGKGHAAFEGMGGGKTLHSTANYMWGSSGKDTVTQQEIDKEVGELTYVDIRTEKGMTIIMGIMSSGEMISWYQKLEEEEQRERGGREGIPTLGALDEAINAAVASLNIPGTIDEEIIDGSAPTQVVGLEGSKYATDSEQKGSDDYDAGLMLNDLGEERPTSDEREEQLRGQGAKRAPLRGHYKMPKCEETPLMINGRDALCTLKDIVYNGNVLRHVAVARRGTDEDSLTKCIEIQIVGDGIMLEVRESTLKVGGGTTEGWNVMRLEIESVANEEESRRGIELLTEGYETYQLAKERSINRAKKEAFGEVREVRMMTALLLTASRIASAVEGREIERRRKERKDEEEIGKGQEISRNYVAAVKRRENERYEAEKAAEEAAEAQVATQGAERVALDAKQAAIQQRLADKICNLEMTKENASAEKVIEVGASIREDRVTLGAAAKQGVAQAEINLGKDFVVIEGISYKIVEITTHFVSDLTVAGSKGHPTVVGKVATLLVAILEEGSMRKWGAKA